MLMGQGLLRMRKRLHEVGLRRFILHFACKKLQRCIFTDRGAERNRWRRMTRLFVTGEHL